MLRAAEPTGPSPDELASWPTERVVLRDGQTLEGYIESEDPTVLRIVRVVRPSGRPMYLAVVPVDQAAIARIDRLPPSQREKLRERIERFAHRAEIEARRRDAVDLQPIGGGRAERFRYRSRWFTLETPGDRAMAQRLAVRLDQVFAAYRQILPPRVEPSQPPRVEVFGTMTEYEAALRRRGVRTDSPACFVEADNIVLFGSELDRLTQQTARLQSQYARLQAELDQLDRDLAERLRSLKEQWDNRGASRGRIARMLAMEKAQSDRRIAEKRRELARVERQNAGVLEGELARIFARLFHETFHAYLENYVYPHQTHDVPRWLNEGLATMFESGLLESGTLRVDAPNREALRRLKAELRGGRSLALAQVLAADQREFLSAEADRYYAYCWGLAYYLAFERRLLRDSALDRYVREEEAASFRPAERFERLLDMPLAQFEPIWRQYILALR